MELVTWVMISIAIQLNTTLCLYTKCRYLTEECEKCEKDAT